MVVRFKKRRESSEHNKQCFTTFLPQLLLVQINKAQAIQRTMENNKDINMNRKEAVIHLFENVEMFNDVVNKPNTIDTLKEKHKIATEEILELRDALDKNDPIEILDAVVDSLYTVLAFFKSCEAIGYDVKGAILAVCENNSTKFVKTATEAEMSVRHYQSQGIECKSVYNEKYDCYSIVDGNGKVRKPLGYKSVELDKFLPKEN